jgi:threonylcarbamoyladenosine tRNA methylthiotransferase MtaB
MKIYLDMVGCRLNQSELEIMARQFTAAGHILVADPADADLAVVNTCTVTGAAAADSRKTIRRIARSGVESIISTGCWSDMHPKLAIELPGVSRVVSNQDKERLVLDLLSLNPKNFEKEPIQRVPIPGSRLRTRAFIKVQDGCRHNCTFCVTTIARGDSRSESAERIIREIRAAHFAGVKETVLTGVQLGSWGADLSPKRSLSDLVQEILSKTDIPRLRLSSLEPWDVSRELIEIVSDNRVARHFHLPLQSGSAVVMRRMARAITPARYTEIINDIRAIMPYAAITTDLLTGFPRETETEFQEGLDFIERVEFADGHVFSYSAREGTPAFSFPDQVPPAIKKERSALIRKLIAENNRAFRKKNLGSELNVLWEQSKSLNDGTWQTTGLTDNYLKVISNNPGNLWNTFSKVRISSLTPDGVQGEIIPLEK